MKKTTQKFVVAGIIAGFLLGIIVPVIYPVLLTQELWFNQSFRTDLGRSVMYFSPISGSVFAVGMLFPAIFGALGGLIGLFLGRFSSKVGK